MEKLLSIIIPTYNMEQLLPRCLDSLVSAVNNDLLEVMVVNDGSKDESLRVANEYKERYPNVVNVIDKPNGNYGSTINAALPLVKGKYVKILDADDWFDTRELERLLNEMANVDVDLIVTHFTQLEPGGRWQLVKYNTMGREVYEYGRVYNLDDVLKDGYIRFFLMHAIAWRTQMLRDMGYRQTEGISYTDTEWASVPVYVAQTIVFFPLNVYQYNMDREGQTMDPKVLMKSVRQLDRVFAGLLEFYRTYDKAQLSEIRKNFIRQYLANRVRILYKIYLLDMPRKDFEPKELEELDARYRKWIEELDLDVRLYPENKLLRIDYVKYWHKYGKRWPVWLEWINKKVDVVVKGLYVILFRH